MYWRVTKEEHGRTLLEIEQARHIEEFPGEPDEEDRFRPV
jgi:hypothetical protein